MSPDSADEIGLRQRTRARPPLERVDHHVDRRMPPVIMRPSMKPNGCLPDSTPAATIGEIGILVGRWPGAGIGRRVGLAGENRCWPSCRAAEDVPLDAQLAAGLAGRLDEAHLQHDLLRLKHLDGVDDIRPELLGDGHGAVDRQASGAVPDSMMRPLTAVTFRLAYGKRFLISDWTSEVS